MASRPDYEGENERRLAELVIPPPQTHSTHYEVDQVKLGEDALGRPALIWREWTGAPNEVDAPRRAVSTYECLDHFERLADVDDASLPSRVLTFAERWGPLRICEHGIPDGHLADANVHFEKITDEESRPAFRFTEPIEAWRRYARHVRCILEIGHSVMSGEPAPAELWRDLITTETTGQVGRVGHPAWVKLSGDPAIDWERGAPWGSIVRKLGYLLLPDRTEWFGIAGVDLDKARLANVLTEWLRYGQVEIAGAWPANSPTLTHYWRYPGLTGALAMQLHTAMADRLYRCEYCRHPFPARTRYPNRLPPTSRAKYCATCGKDGQNAVAQRRFRERRRTAKVDSQSDSHD